MSTDDPATRFVVESQHACCGCWTWDSAWTVLADAICAARHKANRGQIVRVVRKTITIEWDSRKDYVDSQDPQEAP